MGISQYASKEEIKKAFRKLAIKYHPDKNPGEDSKADFQEINEAYSVLMNHKNRVYDYYIKTKKERMPFIPRDIQLHMQISAEEGYWGGSKQIEYHRTIIRENNIAQQRYSEIINIPPKTISGDILTVFGGGNINNKEQGDAHIFITIINEDKRVKISRNGSLDMALTVPWAYALSCKRIDIKLFGKKAVDLQLDDSMEPGHIYAFEKLGFKDTELRIRVFYDFPRNISKEDKVKLSEILDKYADTKKNPL